uniref:Uncharacterized protein n=1 Tax=Globisporangium ultimum (strain ATCC 200006 / CBS 805.95 / DAOM BR144) TaxID=431595 RepID=K3WTU8_GLOUD
MSGEDPEDEFVGDSLVFRVPKEREVYPETVIHINDEIPALRKSWAYVGVKKNVRVADDPILRYIPYLGENTRVNIDPNRYVSTTMDKNKRVEVLGSKSGSVLEIKSLPLSALDDEAMEYLLRLVVFECGDSKNVFNALQQSGKFFQPYSDYCEIKKNDDAARRVLKRVTGVQRLMNDKQLADDVSAIQTYLNVLGRSCWFLQPRPERQSVTDRLKPPIRYFESNYEQFPQGGGLRKTTDYNSSMEWYRDLFCRRCYTYDCDEHGIMQPTPMKRADPIYPVVLRAGIAHRRQKLPEAGNGDDGSAGKPIGLDESAQATDDVADLNMTITTSAAGVIELVDSSSEDEEQVEKDDDDDAQALASVSASDEESAVRRRSKRSQTRISTMASASLKVQEAMQEKERRQQRRADLKQWKKLTRAIDGSEYIDDSYVDIVTEAVRSLASTDTPCSFECWKKKKDMDANGSATIEKTRLLLSDNIETGPEQLENQPSADKQLAPVSHPTPPVFSESETLLLRKLASTLDDNSCLMAAMLKSSTCTCTKISQFLTTEQKTRVSSKDKGGNQNEVSRSADVSSHRRQKNDRHAGTNHSHSGTRELVRRTRMQRQLDKGNSHCYQPCNHEGVCDGCECMKRNHRCDKACACSRDCPNRFQGCKCSMGNCRTKSCPCYSAGRECDPDYCFSCGVSDAAVMGSEENPERRLCYDIGICCNSNLLRSAQRKIGVSFSTTHGWGAFALERIRRGEFLYEYTGALISDDEAERRGNIYDVMAISFLFDVNTDEVVDATRKGNKSKFANHKATVSANCEAKILLVNGEHRIALYARDDIEIGEELFFDYGYTHETAPQWSQVKQRGTQRHEISRHERDITQQFADEDDDDGDY